MIITYDSRLSTQGIWHRLLTYVTFLVIITSISIPHMHIPHMIVTCAICLELIIYYYTIIGHYHIWGRVGIAHGKPALEINMKTKNTHSTALNSPPDSHFNIKCCCGLKGNGNVYFDEKEGEAMLCTECEYWSHIVCQRNGQASKLRAKEAFFCNFCQVRVPGICKLEKDCVAEQRCVVFT